MVSQHSKEKRGETCLVAVGILPSYQQGQNINNINVYIETRTPTWVRHVMCNGVKVSLIQSTTYLCMYFNLVRLWISERDSVNTLPIFLPLYRVYGWD